MFFATDPSGARFFTAYSRAPAAASARDPRTPSAFARPDFLQIEAPILRTSHLLDLPRLPFTCRNACFVRESMKSSKLSSAAKSRSAYTTAAVIQPVLRGGHNSDAI
jgi:hypothetical protein